MKKKRMKYHEENDSNEMTEERNREGIEEKDGGKVKMGQETERRQRRGEKGQPVNETV